VPSVPSGLNSSTHQINVQSCSSNVTVHWTASGDTGGSGLAGYRGVWDSNPATVPVGAANIASNATSFASNIGNSTSARYFHLRAVDVAGNLGVTVHFGPIFANAASVQAYCTGKTNSLGCVPAISTNLVQPSKSAGNLVITCSNVISQKNGLFFFGTAPLAAPFQGGTMCIQAPTIRTATHSSGGSVAGNDCTGTYAFAFSTAVMNLYGIDPGDTIYGQWWMRDPAVASTTGLSNAVRFTVCE